MNRDEVMQTIEAIIKRGNDAEVRRRGDGYVVFRGQKDNPIYDFRVIGRGKGQ